MFYVLQNGCTALHKATIDGNLKIVTLFIDNGCDVNILDKVGFICYIYFLMKRNLHMCDILQDGNTALDVAAHLGLFEIATLLISNRCDMNTRNRVRYERYLSMID